MVEILNDNAKYDLKTIKLKPETYNKLIRAKATLEFRKSELHSFDGLIDHLIDSFMEDENLMTNDPKRIKGDNHE